VLDGTGILPVEADVAVSGDRIAAVGRFKRSDGRLVVDAEGLMVAPGFIDIHTHSDLTLLYDPQGESMVRQGVTTQVVGNCGLTPTPLGEGALEDIKRSLSLLSAPVAWEWRSMGEYLQRMQAVRPSINVASLVGHGTLRAAVMGFADRPPSSREMQAMQELLDRTLAEGAIGMSTGLIYAPGRYADTAELAQLSRVVAARGGVYTTHLRSERNGLFDAIGEAITIGRVAGLPVQISHLKLGGPSNAHQAARALAMIEQARAEGVAVSTDVYPYEAGSTMLTALLPPWVHAGGTKALLERLSDPELRRRIRCEIIGNAPGWDSLIEGGAWERVIVSAVPGKANRRFEGQSLAEVAEQRQCDPAYALFDLLLEEHGEGNMLIFHSMEEDVHTVMRYPEAAIASDGCAVAPHGELAVGKVHPRYYGTFPKVLRMAAEGFMPMAEMVRKMTLLPASQMGLCGRGQIAPGYFADLTIFNPQVVRDLATYADPHHFPQGIESVIVNGELTVHRGEHLGARSGKVFRAGTWVWEA